MSLTSEGENGLIKYNVSRYDDSTRGEVETAIPLMRGGISEKDTGCRARCQLVAGGGDHIWVAKARKHTEMGVVRWRAV